MYQDQLLCVIPPARVQSAERLQNRITASANALRAVFSKLGQVHYASLFLLPPRPSTHGAAAGTSLALEIVVDDLVDSTDLINRVVALGIEILWPLYADYADIPEDGSTETRGRWLRKFLVDNLHLADGGFVGMRDRTVRQIHQEADLYRVVRRKIARIDPKDFDRETLASRIGDAMQRDARFVWASEPAARSEWRTRSLKPVARVIRILERYFGIAWPLVAVGALLLLLAMLGTAVLMVATPILGRDVVFNGPAVFGQWFEQAAPEVILVLTGALLTLGSIILALRRALTVSVGAALFSTVILAGAFIGIGALIDNIPLGVYRLLPDRWTDAVSNVFMGSPIIRGLFPIGDTFAMWGFVATSSVALFLALLALLFLIATALVPPFFGERGVYGTFLFFAFLLLWATHLLGHPLIALFAGRRSSLLGEIERPLVSGYPFADGITKLDGIAGLWLLVVLLGAWLIARLLSWSSVHFHQRVAEFDQPPESTRRPPERAHQTHESIVGCEAELLSRCNHMISLTEISPWRPWQRPWLRFWLWVVGSLGHMWWVDGKLGQARGIHFAHWHVIDHGRRLLFVSNYDGDFSGYLDDFIRGASVGINLIWRRTRLEMRSAANTGQPAVAQARSFPPTRFGLFRGCSHEQWFKAYVRDSMLPHVLRFEAYRQSCADIERATRVRDALFAKRNAVNNDQIMRALES